MTETTQRATMARIGIPLMIVGIVAVMVIPLPEALVDLLLAANITLSVLILLTAMLVSQPLQFSVFPALLLVTTLFRLALNVSTTRLILSHGFGGKVIEAFGGFVVGGNLVIGLVIFLILVVIQFAVITAGAGRVAEVAARFTLDALPGKQMAIDADLNSGLITDDMARFRRQEVAREADFYGAMDGASKFVKGDAIAGVVIVLINLLGGFGVGVFQLGLPVGEAISRFSLLSVGDGLVSQIPALLISVASGIIVTRVTTDEEGGLGADLFAQLLHNRRVLGIGAAAMSFIALLPGLPKVPFLALAAALAIGASRTSKDQAPQAIDADVPALDPAMADSPEGLLAQLRVEPLELELAPDLVDLINPSSGGSLLDRVKSVRRQIAFDLGMVIPLVRTRDNLSLPPSTYVIRVNGVEAGRGEAPPGCVLVLADGDPSRLPGRPTTEPVFGLPAAWVPQDLSEAMEAGGSTVVDRGSVIVTHLSEVVRRHAGDLLSRQDVQALVDAVREISPTVSNDIGGDILGLADVQRVLRGLLAEAVPIRDLVRILEALTARARETRDPEQLLEAARQALAGAISAVASADGVLHAVTLEPLLEQSLLEAVRPGEGGSFLAMDPRQTADLLEALSATLADAERRVRNPVLLCSSQLRPALHRLVAAGRPQQTVMSYSELDRSLNIEPVGVVNLVASSATL